MQMMQPLNLKQMLFNQFDYSDACILVTGAIKVLAANTNVTFKNCAPSTRYVTHLNDDHVETAQRCGYNYAHVQFN